MDRLRDLRIRVRFRGLIAIGGQLLIVASIFGVTGIPPTENQALRSKGDAYREYQKRVSRFVPLPRSGPHSSMATRSTLTASSRPMIATVLSGCAATGPARRSPTRDPRAIR